MLYNPEWKEAPKDIWSLDSLIYWLEKQDPEDQYEYCSTRNCLLGQYFKAMGLKNVRVTVASVTHKPSMFSTRRWVTLPEHFNNVALYNHNFGGALKDAKLYQASYCAA